MSASHSIPAGSGGFVYGPSLPGGEEHGRHAATDRRDARSSSTQTLAMIMNDLGIPCAARDIDREVRRGDYETVPRDLIDYARAHGLSSEGYNQGSWEELKGYIGRGIPVQALMNGDSGEKEGRRFVAVVRFRTHRLSGAEEIAVRHTAGGTVQWLDSGTFLNEWAGTGFDKFFIAYAPAGTEMPEGCWHGVEARSVRDEGRCCVLNNLDRSRNPDSVGGFVHGLVGLAGGALQAAGGAAGLGIQASGDWFDGMADRVPALDGLLCPLACCLYGLGAALAELLGGAGKAMDRLGRAFDRLLRADVDAFFRNLVAASGCLAGGLFAAAGSCVGAVLGALESLAGGARDGASGTWTIIDNRAAIHASGVGRRGACPPSGTWTTIDNRAAIHASGVGRTGACPPSGTWPTTE